MWRGTGAARREVADGLQLSAGFLAASSAEGPVTAGAWSTLFLSATVERAGHVRRLTPCSRRRSARREDGAAATHGVRIIAGPLQPNWRWQFEPRDSRFAEARLTVPYRSLTVFDVRNLLRRSPSGTDSASRFTTPRARFRNPSRAAVSPARVAMSPRRRRIFHSTVGQGY